MIFSKLPTTATRYITIFILMVSLLMLPKQLLAHQTPNTIVLLDVSPGQVLMELQIPLAELELAFGNEVSKNPETVVDRLGIPLRAYLLAHIHPATINRLKWAVALTGMKVEKAVQEASGPAFQEITVHLMLTPPAGEQTRTFVLNYDVIMHQLVTHSALVSVRNDWERGNAEGEIQEVGVIQVDIETGLIRPMNINLQHGSWWAGFKGMVNLGMQHIKEGTDHLLFLLVLLLPATLLVNGKRWAGFAGTRHSVFKLLKTTMSFTVGHSLTLLIGAFGWIHLSPQPVEVLIAFSILISAIHAITPIFPGKETFVAAGFGLVHGLAFASVLTNLQLGAGAMALSILGFNVGIELMQLFVILLVIPWLILLSPTPAYSKVRISAAVLAGIASIAWMTERISGSENMISKWVLQASEYSYVAILALAVITISVFIKQRLKPNHLSR